jgi:hypothetical protein
MSQVKDVVQAKGIVLSSMQGQLDVVDPGSPEEELEINSDAMMGEDWTPQDMAIKVATMAVGMVRTVFRGQMVTTAQVKVSEVIVEVASAIGIRFGAGSEAREEASKVYANMYRNTESVVSTIKGVTDRGRNKVLLAARSKASNFRSFYSRFLYGLEHDLAGTLHALDPSLRKPTKGGSLGNTMAFDGRRKLLDAILDEGIAKADSEYGTVLEEIADAQRVLNEARQLQAEYREKALRPFEISKVEPTKNAVVGADLAEILAEM